MEYWDIYDRNKQLTGRRMKRNDWTMKDGDYHLSVLGVVRRSDGKFLITRRKLDKQWAPGWWEVPGGGVQAGESSLEAVIREIREETGLDVRGCKGGFAFDYHRDNPGEGDNYFVDVYLFEKDFEEKDLILQETETIGGMAASHQLIKALAQEGVFLHYDSIRKVFEMNVQETGCAVCPDVSDAADTESAVERLRSQFAFCLKIDEEKFITRRTYLSDGQRLENDSEHAWHMAFMAFILQEYANEKIDILHTVMMILGHDLVEIYAGDTYAYDEEGKKSQQERELAAADKLYAILPEDQGRVLRSLWEEFEEAKTPEARFARTMDNIQPMMLNVAAGGLAWTQTGIKLSQVLDRNAHTAQGSSVIWEYAKENLLKYALERGYLVDDVPLT